MARTQGTTPRVQRLISLVAVVRVARGDGVRVRTRLHRAREHLAADRGRRGLGLVACALERRNLLLATLVSRRPCSSWWSGSWSSRTRLWHGLPDARHPAPRWDAAGELVGEQARAQVSPRRPLHAAAPRRVTAVWAAVFSCHALAIRAGSPLLALLPTARARRVRRHRARGVHQARSTACSSWPPPSRSSSPTRSAGSRAGGRSGPDRGAKARLSATASRGARRVAAVAVGVRDVVPFLLPGFGSRAVFDISSTNDSDRVRVNPLVSIKASLDRGTSPSRSSRCESDAPSYWRMPSLDHVRRRPLAARRDRRPARRVSPDTILSARHRSAPTRPAADVHRSRATSATRGSRSRTRRSRSTSRIPRCATTSRLGTVTLDDGLEAGDVVRASRRLPCSPRRRSWRAWRSRHPTRSPRRRPRRHPGRRRRRDPGDRRGVDRGARHRLRQVPRDPGPPERTTRSSRTTTPSRRATTPSTLLDFLTRHEARLLPAVRERDGRDAPDPEYPVAGRRRVHPGACATRIRRCSHVTTSELHAGSRCCSPTTAGWRSSRRPDRIEPRSRTPIRHPSVSCSAERPRDVRPLAGARWRRDARATGAAAGSAPAGEPGAPAVPHGRAVPTAPPASSARRRQRARPPGRVIVVRRLVALVVGAGDPAASAALRRRARLRRAGREPRALDPRDLRRVHERAADLGLGGEPGETLREYRSRARRRRHARRTDTSSA